MSLAHLIVSLSSVNADPTTMPEHEEKVERATVVSRNAPTGEQAAPIHSGPKMVGMTLPTAGTLDAKGFIIAARKAKTRNETIVAIASYCGYVQNGDFGSQEQAARAKAQREIRNEKVTGPSREEERAAAKSAAGFVAGMPKPSQRILLNLQARERAAAEAMIDAKTEAEKAQHKAVLDQCRQAISELVG